MCEGRGAEDEDGSCCSLAQGCFFFPLLTVAEGRAHQRGGDRHECAETRGTAVDLLIRLPTP